ncbi:hypothetical protein AAFC00_000385 [Neodothiora populina]|uniref:Uncharacterized protein n=1 Tax=Neodothiora populina TaxID=2781224 RepID=A0ABR3PCQ2_9PEZI
MDILQHRTPPKRRSISDAATAGTGLAPSPTFNELPPRNAANRLSLSKDDHHVPTASPQTPKRPGFLGRGLSLQMPSRVMPLSLGTVASTNASKGPPAPAPLSPQLDTLTSYASPATSLPRHSRGLDFSRACTNLHHSTLAEQSSPDSSPVITQKAMGIGIPSRKASISSMMLDSPNLGPGSTWPQMSLNDRSTVSSSVGSVNMLASDSDSDSDDADLMDPDDDDPIYATPQAHKMNNHSALTPFAQSTASPGATWSNNFSPAHASLMKNFQRGRFRKERSRKSSSSASGASAMASPRTTSPPPLRSIESAGYFPFNRLASSRRESLALGTDQMNISSGNDSDGEGGLPYQRRRV